MAKEEKKEKKELFQVDLIHTGLTNFVKKRQEWMNKELSLGKYADEELLERNQTPFALWFALDWNNKPWMAQGYKYSDAVTRYLQHLNYVGFYEWQEMNLTCQTHRGQPDWITWSLNLSKDDFEKVIRWCNEYEDKQETNKAEMTDPVTATCPSPRLLDGKYCSYFTDMNKDCNFPVKDEEIAIQKPVQQEKQPPKKVQPKPAVVKEILLELNEYLCIPVSTLGKRIKHGRLVCLLCGGAVQGKENDNSDQSTTLECLLVDEYAKERYKQLNFYICSQTCLNVWNVAMQGDPVCTGPLFTFSSL